jgi:hypothetical protein
MSKFWIFVVTIIVSYIVLLVMSFVIFLILTPLNIDIMKKHRWSGRISMVIIFFTVFILFNLWHIGYLWLFILILALPVVIASNSSFLLPSARENVIGIIEAAVILFIIEIISFLF